MKQRPLSWTEVYHQILIAEKCKPCEFYRIVYDVYRKACFSQKIFTNVLDCLK